MKEKNEAVNKITSILDGFSVDDAKNIVEDLEGYLDVRESKDDEDDEDDEDIPVEEDDDDDE